MNKSKFIIDSSGVNAYIATIISNFSYNNEEYCIYVIPKKNEDSNIHVAKVINNNLVPITNDKEIINIKKLMKEFKIKSAS